MLQLSVTFNPNPVSLLSPFDLLKSRRLSDIKYARITLLGNEPKGPSPSLPANLSKVRALELRSININMEQKVIEKVIKEYSEKYPIYSDFSIRIKNILQDILDSDNIDYHSIESRPKELVSLRQKLESGVVDVSSLNDIRDLVGVRIIAYVYKDISDIEKMVNNNFEANAIEIEEKLGTDRVGYRSHHWLVGLPSARVTLPEYKKFTGLKAELQIRTILQHAWAQIGHNQVYKPNVVLPDKIKRDFTLLSGLLEIADNEFGRISGEISNYSHQVDKLTDSGDLDIEIDSVSLRNYFEKKFGMETWIDQKFGPKDDMIEVIIEELSIIGINTLRQLDNIIPKGFKDVTKKIEKETNYCGISRSIMVVNNPELYFEKAWRKSWVIGSDPEKQLAFYKYYNIDVEGLINKYSE